MAVPLRVLLVEDLESDAALVLRALRHGGFDPSFRRVDGREAMLAALLAEPWDVVLSDHTIPGFGGPDALALLRATGLDLPFILVSGAIGEEAAVEMMKAGAHDYVPKHDLARLVPAVQRGLRESLSRRQQRRLENALRQSDEQLRTLFERSPLGITVARAGVTVAANPAYLRMFGYEDPSEVVGVGFLSRIAPACRTEIEARAQARERGEPVPESYETRGLRKDGTEFLLLVQTARMDLAKGPATVAFFSDITKHRHADEALRRSEERYRTTLEAMDDAISVKDLEGRYVTVNAAFARRFGLEEEQIVGKTAHDLYGPEYARRVGEMDRRVMAGEVVDREVAQLDLGAARIIHARKVPLRDQEGRVVGVVTISRNVTERKQMEEQLQRAQRLETAGRIAGQVAHDLGNLLVPLAAYPELIKARVPEGDQVHAYCDAMLESVWQMAAINEDLLTLGRRAQYSPEPTDLNRVVRQAAERLSPLHSGLELRLDLAPALPPVAGSQTQLLRVVYNLLTNAQDAVGAAGLVGVRTEDVRLDHPLGRYTRVEPGRYVRVTVSDTGCGIPTEIRSRIFDPFFTTKRADARRGTGLGLSIVQAIVDDHRGYVDLESEVGKRTTFRLYLPVDEATTAATADGLPPRGCETILVVDDDPGPRDVVQQLLQSLGYQVEVVPSGEEALARLEEVPADLLILDVAMPAGINGVETYRRALQIHADQRAILLSGFAAAERIAEARALGAGTCLRKPVSLQDLANAVRRELDR